MARRPRKRPPHPTLSLEDPITGIRRGFASLEELMAYLHEEGQSIELTQSVIHL